MGPRAQGSPLGPRRARKGLGSAPQDPLGLCRPVEAGPRVRVSLFGGAGTIDQGPKNGCVVPGPWTLAPGPWLLAPGSYYLVPGPRDRYQKVSFFLWNPYGTHLDAIRDAIDFY